jgi:hypothetical protein
MSLYCPFRRGTLLILSGPVEHLHIVLNDPVHYPEAGYDGCLLVNISSMKSHRPYDASCILEAGEHPFIKQQSFVVYKEAVIKNSEDLSTFVETGEFSTRDPVSEAIFERVMAGFQISRRVTPKIKRFIKNYI